MRMLIKSLILITVLSLTAYAEIPMTTYLDFSNAWFKPTLTENKDPVCTSLLTQSQRDFFSKPSKQYNSKVGPIPNDQHWKQRGEFLAPLLIEGKSVYVRRFFGRGCGGACESEHMAASKTPFPATDSYGSDISFNENQITESIPAYRNNIGFYSHQNDYYAVTKNEITNAYKLKSDATWEKVCVIANTPSEKKYKEISITYNSITLLTQKVNALLGEEGSMCGSMHTLSRWKDRINENLSIATYRPWALSEYPNDDATYNEDIKNLETWALQDLSQKLAFDEYTKQLSITTKNLSDFYQKTYKWSRNQSDEIAYNALTAAISSGIRFYMYDQLNQDQKNLLTAITDKKSLTTIKQLSENPKALSKNILNISIKNPEALAFFLSENSNPNEQNEFNKSLLMYAAQYNQLESAKILLSKGANPNLFTIIPEDTCNFTLSKSNMTALHYAVRYASADLIKLLLKSGANPFARTSEETGGRPIDWLHKYTAENATEKNANLTKVNITELENLLSMPPADEAARRALSLNSLAEKAFQKGNLVDAYSNSTLALGLDDNNERALANLSLILSKQGKQEEALEASHKLITKGKDVNQIANAWFNYGLICEKSIHGYISYNGNNYCEYGKLQPFISSFKTKPTLARANKIISIIEAGANGSCEFSPKQNGLVTLIQRCSDYDNHFCILHSPQHIISDHSISFLKLSREIPNDFKSPFKIFAVKPAKIVESFSIGDYQLTRLARDYRDEAVEFGDKICTGKSELLPASEYLQRVNSPNGAL